MKFQESDLRIAFEQEPNEPYPIVASRVIVDQNEDVPCTVKKYLKIVSPLELLPHLSLSDKIYDPNIDGSGGANVGFSWSGDYIRKGKDVSQTIIDEAEFLYKKLAVKALACGELIGVGNFVYALVPANKTRKSLPYLYVGLTYAGEL